MSGAGEELLDVVDAGDRVVGQATRRKVHARGLWHRAIHVFVFDRKGRIFLQKRSLKKDVAPGLWDSSCSGHVDAGESYDASAVREFFEELGVALDRPPERWFRAEARVETGWEFVGVYRLRHEGPFALNAEEIERGEWFSAEAVDAGLAERPAEFSPSFRYLWGKRPR